MVRVSVVIPCYNQGRYVDDAVASVLNQSFDDFEIIVINDGSTDADTIERLGDYDAPKTRVIHTGNQGLAAARNNGIRAAAGEYILPLDADDRIGRDYMEAAVRVLDTDPDVGIVYCEAEYIGAKTGPWDLPAFEMGRMLVDNIIFCSGFFRRKDWERVGGYNVNMIYGWEDWDFWLSLLEIGRKVHRIPRLLFYYRVSETSMIGGMSESRQFHMRMNIRSNHPDLYANVDQVQWMPKIAQVFIDNGSGFNDRDCLSQVIARGHADIRFDLKDFPRAASLRFDPANDCCVLRVIGMTAVLKDGRHVAIDAVNHNAFHHMDDIYLFTSSDPWIVLDMPESGIEKLRLSLEYIAVGLETHKYMVERRSDVMMAQAGQIRSKNNAIRELTEHNRSKDNHIRDLERQIGEVRSLFIWGIIKMLILLKKAFSTLTADGFGALFRKIRNYLYRRGGAIKMELFERDYRRWVKKNTLTEKRKKRISDKIAGLLYRPKISVVMPVGRGNRSWVERAVASVRAQHYQMWELLLVADATVGNSLKSSLETCAVQDNRIDFRHLENQRGVSAMFNAALAKASGEFVAVLDPDDELAPDALFENAWLLNAHPDADMIYSDEDRLGADGKRCTPMFKPDWSPDMFFSYMYTRHLAVYRKSLLQALGGCRKGFGGAWDYDLVLRLIEKTSRIHHLPEVLYHQRIQGDMDTEATDRSARKALTDYMQRNRIPGNVEQGLFPGSHRVRRDIQGAPAVSIIIPFRDQAPVLITCVDSILEKTDYENYRIFLINNGSTEKRTIDFLESIKAHPAVSVLDDDRPFNFSAIINFAVAKTRSEYLLFLNNDTEVISRGWIQSMLEYAQRPDVGCVGGLLYYPNDTVQHGGVILGLGDGGIAGHSHVQFERDSVGYMGRLKVVNNLSAVTAACLMTRRSVFDDVGGFDENITHAFNDVDFCLKVRETGRLIVYTPYAELYHHESLSRGQEDTPEKIRRFNKEVDMINARWGRVLDRGDPYYSPNLSRAHAGFAVKF